jgi:hypothetical protein
MPAPDLAYLNVYVNFRHRDIGLREEVPGRAEPPAAGRLAAALATRLYRGEFTAEAANRVQVAHVAGLFIYAMDGYGLTYEDVCGVAGHEVAQVLAQITPDNRLTEPKRHHALRTAIYQADPLAKVVKLAEIVAGARRILERCDATVLIKHAQYVKHVVDRGVHLVKAMHCLVEAKLGPQLEEAQHVLSRVADAVDEVRRPGRRRR